MKTHSKLKRIYTAREKAKLSAELLREGFRLEAAIKTTISNSTPRGRTYKIGSITSTRKSSQGLGLKTRTTKKGNKTAIVGAKIYRASAPGQPPAIKTGGLINSIKTIIKSPLRVKIIASKKYARRLDSPRGFNRPFFKVTVLAFRLEYVKRMENFLKNL